MSRGEFSSAAREAIMEACGFQCVGCGRTQPLNTQHRIARGMGGTRNPQIGEATNGIILCGSGTTGCHGWTEGSPTHALALGWRVERHRDPTFVPFWTRFGWRRWNVDLTVTWLGDEEVPKYVDRGTAAITAYTSRMRAVGS